MPTLRNRLLRPEPWLAASLLLVVLVGADAMSPPQSQVSVRLFVASVASYHRYIHPFTSQFIRCRYKPTCSEYAIQAVSKYGIVKGGSMSVRRVLSCQPSVSMGTSDPVP